MGGNRHTSGQVPEHLFRKESNAPSARQRSLRREESWEARPPAGKLRLEGLVPDGEQETAACSTPGEGITDSPWLCSLTGGLPNLTNKQSLSAPLLKLRRPQLAIEKNPFIALPCPLLRPVPAPGLSLAALTCPWMPPNTS